MKTLEVNTRIQLKNVLFATDFSRAAAAALPYAGELAKHYGAKLYALHVRAPIINPMTPPAGWPALEKAAEQEEQERRETLRNAIPGIEPTVLIREGDLWTNITSVIEKEKIDLVVIGTRGRTGVEKFLLGSAAEEILREATCPVLTVGPHAPAEPKLAGNIREIVYATDFTSDPLPAAPYALSIAQEYQAHLTLLHVIEERKVDQFVVPEDVMESCKRKLANLVPTGAELWCASDCVVERGPIAERILDVARSRRADLIVVGIHPATGFPGAASHLPISVAHEILAHAMCPVLTVPGNNRAVR